MCYSNKQEIIGLYNIGLTYQEIADIYGLSKQAIHQRLRNTKKVPIQNRDILFYVLQVILENEDFDYMTRAELAKTINTYDMDIISRIKKSDILQKIAKERNKRLTIKRLFEGNYIVDDITGCWNWKGSITGSGYGVVIGKIYNGKKIIHIRKSAHRCSYEIFVGKIKKGLHILHKCNNRECVNPEHLYAGTHQQNMKDRDESGNSTGPKFDYGIAKEIRKIYSKGNITYYQLAKLYNCTQASIYKIVNHITYRENSSVI